jgi:hypothetical protein
MDEQLEILDLGDAMLVTKCSTAPGGFYDHIWGPGHWAC